LAETAARPISASPGKKRLLEQMQAWLLAGAPVVVGRSFLPVHRPVRIAAFAERAPVCARVMTTDGKDNKAFRACKTDCFTLF
jgi:hypothetical protein